MATQTLPLTGFFYVLIIFLSFLVALLAILASSIGFIVALLFRKGVHISLALLLVCVGVFGGLAFSTWMFYAQQPGNERRAEVIAAAIQRYRTDTGRFPSTLDDLKPRYLTDLPTCWYGFWPYDFAYSPGEYLKFMELPGQCGRFYYFSSGTWRSECL